MQDDEVNQGFLELAWYNHISTKHHGNLAGWSRRIIAEAFLRQAELIPLFRFATLSARPSLQCTAGAERIRSWNDVLDQRVENDELWDNILEQLEFRSLSGSEGEAKKTIEVCIGLDGFDWTSSDDSHAQARTNPAPETDLRSSRSTMAPRPNSCNIVEFPVSMISGSERVWMA
ncbi:MAG: hypothetical protein M1822_000163 [Bathelium mastoideum]|nr:MAG: hypothetical protein M1822_000163 [Bathelium mastoideum]